MELACSVCGVMTTFRCSRCKILMFCSSECMRAGWKDHRHLCKIFQKIPVKGGVRDPPEEAPFLRDLDRYVKDNAIEIHKALRDVMRAASTLVFGVTIYATNKPFGRAGFVMDSVANMYDRFVEAQSATGVLSAGCTDIPDPGTFVASNLVERTGFHTVVAYQPMSPRGGCAPCLVARTIFVPPVGSPAPVAQAPPTPIMHVTTADRPGPGMCERNPEAAEMYMPIINSACSTPEPTMKRAHTMAVAMADAVDALVASEGINFVDVFGYVICITVPSSTMDLYDHFKDDASWVAFLAGSVKDAFLDVVKDELAEVMGNFASHGGVGGDAELRPFTVTRISVSDIEVSHTVKALIARQENHERHQNASNQMGCIAVEVPCRVAGEEEVGSPLHWYTTIAYNTYLGGATGTDSTSSASITK